MSSEYQSDDRQSRIERLGALLRDRRRRLESYPTLAAPTDAQLAAWDADLYTYDDALVSVADLLDVYVAPGARDELSAEQRREIEDAVTAAGLDLRASNAPIEP